MDDEENEYERARQERIKANEAMMRELFGKEENFRIGEKKAQPKKAAPAAAAKRKGRSSKAKQGEAAQPKAKKVLPRRSSARLMGVEADSEVLKRKYEEEAEAAREAAEEAKRARHEARNLAALAGEALGAEELASLRGVLGSLVAESNSTEAAPPTRERTELMQVLQKMEIRSNAKVTTKRVYSMVVHPTLDRDLVFVGDKEGSIGVWDARAMPAATDEMDAEELPEGRSWNLQVHGSNPVTCLKIDPVQPNLIYSCSYDSTVRVLNLDAPETKARGSDTNVSREVWAGQDDVLLSIFDILAPQTHAAAFTATPAPGLNERSMWIADHRGGITHVDLREPWNASKRSQGSTTRRWQVCEKKVGGMSVNRLAPHCIATASLDQHVRLFDVRSLRTLPETPIAPYNATNVDSDALEALQLGAQIDEHQARLACTSVDFSPSGDQLVGLSYDDVIKVWELPSLLSSESPAAEVPATPRSSARRSAASTPVTASRTSSRAKTENGTPFRIKGEATASVMSPHLLSKPVRTKHNMQTGKWLTLFRARYNANPNADAHFSIGSMNRSAMIYGSDGTLLRTLSHDSMTAVPAVTAMHPLLPGRLATGNASGRCTYWSPE